MSQVSVTNQELTALQNKTSNLNRTSSKWDTCWSAGNIFTLIHFFYFMHRIMQHIYWFHYLWIFIYYLLAKPLCTFGDSAVYSEAFSWKCLTVFNKSDVSQRLFTESNCCSSAVCQWLCVTLSKINNITNRRSIKGHPSNNDVVE